MEKIELASANGAVLGVSWFESKPNVKAVVIIASAAGILQKYYHKFAFYLRDQGFHVLTFDYSGIGASLNGSVKKSPSNVVDWAANDLQRVLCYSCEKFGQTKTVLIGHSLGGQLLGLCPGLGSVDLVILVAAQSNYWKFWPVKQRRKLWLTYKWLHPFYISLYGYFPASKWTSRQDLPGPMAKQWSSWCLQANYLWDEVAESQLYFKTFTGPLYSLSTDKDCFAPLAAVDWLTQKYSAAHITRIHLKPLDYKVDKIGHFGFFHSRLQDQVWPVFYRILSDES